MTKTKEKLMVDQNPLKNHLYNTFVILQTLKENAMTHDTEVEVQHEIILTTNTIIHKTDTVQHLEIDLVMTKIPLLHTTLSYGMTTIKETRDVIALLIDHHTDHLIDVTLVTDIDHAHNQGIITILQDIHLLLDRLRGLEVLHFLDLAQTSRQETNLIQFNPKPKMTQITLKYICITQLKWQTL